MTIAVEHICGVKITSVPKTSRYLFFNLNNRRILRGLKTTRNIAVGKSVRPIAATRVIIDAPRSKRFHPELRYRLTPRPKTLVRASAAKTIRESTIYHNCFGFLLLKLTFL